MPKNRNKQQKQGIKQMSNRTNRITFHSFDNFDRSKSSSLKKNKQLNISVGPGPADYTITSNLSKKQGWTMSNSRWPSYQDQKPDPWTYVPQDLKFKVKSPCATIGNEKRTERITHFPSPASYLTNYNILFRTVRHPIMGTEKRDSPTKVTPGPTDYDPSKSKQYKNNSKTPVIGTQRRFIQSNTQEDINPGPSNYKPIDEFDSNVKQKRGYTMGRKLRIRTQYDEPNHYAIYDTASYKQLLLTRAPAFTIKKSIKKNDFRTISPGPAMYLNYREKMDKGIIISKSPRTLHEVNSIPGPLDYTLSQLRDTPSYSIPKEKRKTFQIQKMPGPADYSPVKRFDEKYKSVGIGFGSRTNFVKNQKMPGPADYQTQDLRQAGMKISHVGRSENISKTVGPGPAGYFTNSSKIQR